MFKQHCSTEPPTLTFEVERSSRSKTSKSAQQQKRKQNTKTTADNNNYSLSAGRKQPRSKSVFDRSLKISENSAFTPIRTDTTAKSLGKSRRPIPYIMADKDQHQPTAVFSGGSIKEFCKRLFSSSFQQCDPSVDKNRHIAQAENIIMDNSCSLSSKKTFGQFPENNTNGTISSPVTWNLSKKSRGDSCDFSDQSSSLVAVGQMPERSHFTLLPRADDIPIGENTKPCSLQQTFLEPTAAVQYTTPKIDKTWTKSEMVVSDATNRSLKSPIGDLLQQNWLNNISASQLSVKSPYEMKREAMKSLHNFDLMTKSFEVESTKSEDLPQHHSRTAISSNVSSQRPSPRGRFAFFDNSTEKGAPSSDFILTSSPKVDNVGITRRLSSFFEENHINNNSPSLSMTSQSPTVLIEQSGNNNNDQQVSLRGAKGCNRYLKNTASRKCKTTCLGNVSNDDTEEAKFIDGLKLEIQKIESESKRNRNNDSRPATEVDVPELRSSKQKTQLDVTMVNHILPQESAEESENSSVVLRPSKTTSKVLSKAQLFEKMAQENRRKSEKDNSSFQMFKKFETYLKNGAALPSSVLNSAGKENGVVSKKAAAPRRAQTVRLHNMDLNGRNESLHKNVNFAPQLTKRIFADEHDDDEGISLDLLEDIDHEDENSRLDLGAKTKFFEEKSKKGVLGQKLKNSTKCIGTPTMKKQAQRRQTQPVTPEELEKARAISNSKPDASFNYQPHRFIQTGLDRRTSASKTSLSGVCVESSYFPDASLYRKRDEQAAKKQAQQLIKCKKVSLW